MLDFDFASKLRAIARSLINYRSRCVDGRSTQEAFMKTTRRKSVLAFAAATLMAGILTTGATFAAEMKVKLSGDQEVPGANSSIGERNITVNDDMSVSGSVTTTGIKATAAHIHEAAAGRTVPL
jgi:hypothetical protein